MSFSLYGDLPKPKSAKNDNEKSSDGGEVAKAWAAVAPQTAPKQEAPAPAAPAPAETPKPTGWALYNQFRPVMRKPTIQAKPKMHKPIIPVGGKVISTMPAQTYQAAQAESTAQTAAPVVQSAVPLKTSVEDVNGFANLPSNVKKAKRIHKNKQKDPLAAIEFDLSEDYDPVRPNDYEAYMDQQRQRREEEERMRLEQITRLSRRSRSRSDASSESSSRSRSPSPPRYNKMFAPPESLRGPEAKRVLSENIQSEPSSAIPDTLVPSLAPTNPINLEETAEDAWLRRARLSGKANVVAPKSPSPSPEPDEHDSLAEGEDDLDKNSNYEGSGGQHNLPRGNETARQEATQIVLLRNMVGPGEVDDMLQHETADECGKYGKVERCLIFEVPESQVGANQAVRIFVKFDSAIAAQRAVDDLNGRYFGGRVVTATFYDPARFEKLDLGPTKEEMSNLAM